MHAGRIPALLVGEEDDDVGWSGLSWTHCNSRTSDDGTDCDRRWAESQIRMPDLHDMDNLAEMASVAHARAT